MTKDRSRSEKTGRQDSPSKAGERGGWGALAVALVAGAALRLRGLGEPGLWTDEFVAYWAASAASVGEVIGRAATCMATPPLSFVAQHLSLAAAGKSEWALRLPSALAGIAALPVVFLAGRRMFGAAAGAAAALVLALHPFALWVSTDGRPYAWAVLLGAASVWAFSEMLRSGRIDAIGCWAAATAALVLDQFVFLPLVGAQAAAYAVARRAGEAPALPPRRALGALAAAAVLSLPVLPQVLRVAGRAGALTWPTPPDFPPWLAYYFQPHYLLAAVLVFQAVDLARRARGAAETGWRSSGRRADLVTVVLSFLLPSLAVGGAALALDLPPLVKARYGAAYLPAAALWLGWLLTRPARRAGRLLLAGAFLAGLVLGGVAPALRDGKPFNRDAGWEDWRGALGHLRDSLSPGDLVLARTGLVEAAGLYDGTFPDECRDYVAAPVSDFYLPVGPEIVLLPHEMAEAPYPDSYAARLGSRVTGRDRLWLVMINPPDARVYYDRLVAYLREATGAPLAVAGARNFGPVNVILLARPGAA